MKGKASNPIPFHLALPGQPDAFHRALPRMLWPPAPPLAYLQVDSRTVEGTNKAQLDQWIEDYGENSDFVRIRVRGEFPRSGSSQPPDLVSQARRTKAQGFEKLPIIMACDVARFGDNQTVIGMRQGRKFQILGKYRSLDIVQVTERIISFRDKHAPDAVVVDGDGLGAGVVDQLQHRGYNKGLFEFHGGERPRDFEAATNCRSFLVVS